MQSKWAGPSAVFDGIKNFVNDDRVTKLYGCLPLTLSIWHTTVMFYGLVIIIKILIPSTAGDLGCPF